MYMTYVSKTKLSKIIKNEPFWEKDKPNHVMQRFWLVLWENQTRYEYKIDNQTELNWRNQKKKAFWERKKKIHFIKTVGLTKPF